MNNKKWIKIFFLLSFLAIVFVGIINYIVDPGYVYSKKYSSNKYDEYTNKLLLSKNGLIATGWNERLVKASLAKHSENFDCIVIGSSHIMQISSITNTGNISDVCPKLLNLGVSGGSFEDLFVFSSIINSNYIKPNKIFIDITPWLFKFEMDSRYKINKVYYDKFLQELNGINETHLYSNYSLKLFKNLFSLEYFITSLKNYKLTFKKVSIKYPLEMYDYKKGYVEPITLQDGSHIYDSNYIKKAKINIKNIKAGGGNYKIENKIYDEQALTQFEKLIKFYQLNNIKVNFILTPYHPNVFKNGITKPVKHMIKVENLAHELSKKYSVKVYGSFFSEKLGCKEDEFLDYMHTNKDCLDRIRFEE